MIYYITKYIYLNPLYKIILGIFISFILKLSFDDFSLCMTEDFTSSDSESSLETTKRVRFVTTEEETLQTRSYTQHLREELKTSRRLIERLEGDAYRYRMLIRKLQEDLEIDRSRLISLLDGLEEDFGITAEYF